MHTLLRIVDSMHGATLCTAETQFTLFGLTQQQTDALLLPNHIYLMQAFETMNTYTAYTAVYSSRHNPAAVSGNNSHLAIAVCPYAVSFVF